MRRAASNLMREERERESACSHYGDALTLDAQVLGV